MATPSFSCSKFLCRTLMHLAAGLPDFSRYNIHIKHGEIYIYIHIKWPQSVPNIPNDPKVFLIHQMTTKSTKWQQSTLNGCKIFNIHRYKVCIPNGRKI
jgi:hypothetical protein